MKILALLFFSLNLFSLPSDAGELALTVPPLVKEQPLIDSIYRIENHIIVRTDNYDRIKYKNSYPCWRLDEGKNQFMPFINNAGEKVTAVSENGSFEVIASSKGNRVSLSFIDQPSRNINLTNPGRGPFRISANADFTFLVFVDKVVEISRKGNIREVDFKGMFPEIRQTSSAHELIELPRAITATKDELILGYDVGEFGGALYAMKIGENGLVTESKLLISENVSAIDQDAKGMIWIAGRRSFQGGLYSYDGKTITPIISESDLAKENVDHKVVMFDNSPRFDGVTVNSNGDVIFIAEDIGIFSHSTGNFLRSLFVGDLRVQYEMPGDIIIGSDPQGIIEKGENLYIASRSLGVFCFEKTADGNYVPIRQIIFNESHTRTPKR